MQSQTMTNFLASYNQVTEAAEWILQQYDINKTLVIHSLKLRKLVYNYYQAQFSLRMLFYTF